MEISNKEICGLGQSLITFTFEFGELSPFKNTCATVPHHV